MKSSNPSSKQPVQGAARHVSESSNSSSAGTRSNASLRDEAERIQQDLDIVAAVRRSEAGGLADLAERMECVPRILAAHNAKLGRPLGADELADLAQDTLLIILRKLQDFEGRSSLEGWAYRICYFELMNRARRKRREQRPKRELEAEGEEVGALVAPDPWRYEHLHRAIDRLPGEEATVVRLKHFQELTFDEIAVALSAPSSTVKARYYRGMETLRQDVALAQE